MPSRWTIRCNSGQGELVLDVRALGRAYYPWDYKKGIQVLYWNLCLCSGTFTFPDGRIVPIRDRLANHEIIKVIMVHDERMTGPWLD
jgi:hypothetical protein